jgi:hypothetical protein
VEVKNKEIAIKKEELMDIRNWIDQEADKIIDKEQLEKELDELVSKHNQEQAVIKKERAIAIDKLRKEMLFNIRNVKMQMLSMNEEQLQGTTKLTVKQNF